MIERHALTGFVVDLCGSISTDRCAARGCLLWCSNLSDASTWAAGAPLPMAALVAMSSPRLRLSRDDFTPHAKQLVQCALGYF
jgi:hypothetical protein